MNDNDEKKEITELIRRSEFQNSQKIKILERAMVINEELKAREKENIRNLKEFLHNEEFLASKDLSFSRFGEIILFLNPRKEIPPGREKETDFLLDIVRKLPNVANRDVKSSFKKMVRVLWKGTPQIEGLRRKWEKDFSQEDCQNALRALLKCTNILIPCLQDKYRYYLFNPSDRFYNFASLVVFARASK